MNVILKKIENSEAYLEFEIEAGVFDKGLEKAYRKVVKELDVPGFRKGTASRAVVEAQFGLQILLEDAMEMVVPDAYHAAIRELKLDTMGEPDIEVGYIVSGQPVTVKVNVAIRPEVILGQIDGLEVMVPEAKPVTDELKKQAVVAAALEQCDFAVPEYLVMEQATSMLDQFKKQLESQGGSIDMYLQLVGSNVENLKREIWKDAKNATRTSFMLDKLIEEKGFEISEEELDKGIEAFAIQIGMKTENAKQNLGPLVDQVVYKLKTEKAIQYLVDHAVIKIVKALERQVV